MTILNILFSLLHLHIWLWYSLFIGPLRKVLKLVHSVEIESDNLCPVPINTTVLLDHMEINKNTQDMLFFLKITDERWLVPHMTSLKGYTLIAIKNILHRNERFRFQGTGKLSVLTKHVSFFWCLTEDVFRFQLKTLTFESIEL